MTEDRGKVAIVTGGASGIGAALARVLHRRGIHVVITDVNEAAAVQLAEELGDGAQGEALDVTDAAAVRDVVHRAHRTHGRLDYMFNNAGVGLGGEVRDMTLADWKPLIDVNIWGVVHGIDAAYPLMVEQGFGHIVNTASGAGLTPRPGMTGYAATKHAVVGLSTSLRAEAASLGVGVTAVCPGYIKTNIIDATKFVKVDGKALTSNIPIRPISAEDCAKQILRAVDRNRAIEIIGFYPWLDWVMFRIAPGLAIRIAEWRTRQFRAHRTE